MTSFSLRDQIRSPPLGAVHEDAHAVPLHLVGPARTGHVVAPGGEHRQHTAIQAGAGPVQ